MSARLVVTRHTRVEDLPELLTIDEFAAWSGLGRGKAYDLVRRDELPVVRFGRLIRVPRSALAALSRGEAVAS
jgi:excisionase family DNA binding protein